MFSRRVLFLVVACAVGPRLAAQTPPVTDYVIGAQDVLTITSYDQADLTGKFTVEADGTFTFPMIGRVRAGGSPRRRRGGAGAARRRDARPHRPRRPARAPERTRRRERGAARRRHDLRAARGKRVRLRPGQEPRRLRAAAEEHHRSAGAVARRRRHRSRIHGADQNRADGEREQVGTPRQTRRHRAAGRHDHRAGKVFLMSTQFRDSTDSLQHRLTMASADAENAGSARAADSGPAAVSPPPTAYGYGSNVVGDDQVHLLDYV